MFQTIRNKFVVFFIILVTITITLIGIISDYIIQKHITRGVSASFLEDLKHEIIKIESFIKGVKADLNLLSGDTTYNFIRGIDAGEKDEIDKWRLQMENKFIKYMEVKRIYTQIKYIDSKGEEFVSTDFDGEKAKITTEEPIEHS